VNIDNNIICFVISSLRAVLKSQGQVLLEVKEKDADVVMPLRYLGNLPVVVKDVLVTSKVNLVWSVDVEVAEILIQQMD